MTRLSQLANWFRRIFNRSNDWFLDRLERPYRTMIVEEDLPVKMTRRTLYIVEEDGYAEQAAMRCPCGRSHILHLNLLPDDRPLWKVTHHSDETVSLHPSVWRKKDCRSHFWFRKGRVHWVPNGKRSSSH